MAIKFPSKNVSIFGKLQTVEGTPVNPVATDALAVTDLVGTVAQETETFQYLGDILSRDENTTLKDTSAEVTCTSFMPVLGSLNPGLAVADAPYSQWFQACGGDVSVDSSTGIVTVDNKTVSNDLLTIDYMKDSPDATAGKQKRYRFSDCRGMVDLNLNASSKTTLAFKFLGNTSVPTMETRLIADFGNQKFNIGAPVRLVNMVHSRISEISTNQTAINLTNITGDGTTVTATVTSHSISVGSNVTIDGTVNHDGDYYVTGVTGTDILFASTVTTTEATTGTVIKRLEPAKKMCTNSITAPNLFGFAYERYLITCEEGFSKVAEPTDVNIVILEDEVGGLDFDPDANIEKFFEVDIKYGTGDGKYINLVWNKLQLADTKDTTIGTYFGKDITFRNTQNSTIIFS